MTASPLGGGAVLSTSLLWWSPKDILSSHSTPNSSKRLSWGLQVIPLDAFSHNLVVCCLGQSWWCQLSRPDHSQTGHSTVMECACTAVGPSVFARECHGPQPYEHSPSKFRTKDEARHHKTPWGRFIILGGIERECCLHSLSLFLILHWSSRLPLGVPFTGGYLIFLGHSVHRSE